MRVLSWRHRKFQNAPIVLKIVTDTEFDTQITKIKVSSSYEGEGKRGGGETKVWL